jgi:hypothetical protein
MFSSILLITLTLLLSACSTSSVVVQGNTIHEDLGTSNFARPGMTFGIVRECEFVLEDYVQVVKFPDEFGVEQTHRIEHDYYCHNPVVLDQDRASQRGIGGDVMQGTGQMVGIGAAGYFVGKGLGKSGNRITNNTTQQGGGSSSNSSNFNTNMNKNHNQNVNDNNNWYWNQNNNGMMPMNPMD